MVADVSLGKTDKSARSWFDGIIDRAGHVLDRHRPIDTC
jgi:hypothetical protein